MEVEVIMIMSIEETNKKIMSIKRKIDLYEANLIPASENEKHNAYCILKCLMDCNSEKRSFLRERGRELTESDLRR